MTVDTLQLCAWLGQLATSVVTDADDAAELASRLETASSLDAGSFAAEGLALARIIAENVDTPEDFDAIKPGAFSDGATARTGAILVAVALALAGCRAAWISRPQARAARERIVTAGDTALAVAAQLGADGVDLYGWLDNLIQLSVRLISDQAANAVPVVQVETGISLPATVLAFKLYGDANRASSLVDVAGAVTPMLMPVAFNALES